jgi:hypothetical protein
MGVGFHGGGGFHAGPAASPAHGAPHAGPGSAFARGGSGFHSPGHFHDGFGFHDGFHDRFHDRFHGHDRHEHGHQHDGFGGFWGWGWPYADTGYYEEPSYDESSETAPTEQSCPNAQAPPPSCPSGWRWMPKLGRAVPISYC